MYHRTASKGRTPIMQQAPDGSFDLDEAAAPQQPWELVDAPENPSPSAPSTPPRTQQRRVEDVTASASSLGRELARDTSIRRRVGLPPVQSEASQLRAEASRLRADIDDLRASRFDDGALLDENSRQPPPTPPPPAAEASLEPGEMLALAIGGAALVGIGAFLAVRHIGVAAALAAGTALVAVGEAERQRQEREQREPTTPTTPRRRRASGGI